MPEESALPTADEAFGAATLPTIDEAFPPEEEAERERLRYRQINMGDVRPSPLRDFLMSDDGPVGTVFHSAGRVARAFGEPFKEDLYSSTGLSDETKKAIKDWSGYDSWSEKHRDIAKAANQMLLEQPALQLSAAWHAMQGVFRGAQGAAAQVGAELGAPGLGREIAAIPEAFPTGFHSGIPSPAAIARARALGIIGPEGEAGWKGTAPPPAEEVPKAPPPTAEAPAPAMPPVDPKIVTEDATAAAERQPPAPADIHEAAHAIDPQSVEAYDALVQRRDVFRRWIEELRATRNQQYEAGAPNQDAIANLQARIDNPDTTPRLRKKYEERLGPLVEERDAYLNERPIADNRDMALVRARLQETDEAMRDLLTRRNAAYREAAQRHPELVPNEPEPAVIPAAEGRPAEVPAQAAETAAERTGAPREAEPAALPPAKEGVASRPSAQGPTAKAVVPEPEKAITAPETVSPGPTVVARTIEQQRDFIRNDVARQLIRAGRPKEEAEAAGQLIAARYETRAARFNGALGTAEDLYRREGAEILGPGMRAQQPVVQKPKVPRPEEKLSLVPFLIRRGGISPSGPLASDLKAILGNDSRIFKEGGMTLDRAREAAAEAGYIANEGRGGTENRGGGTSTIRDLLDAINQESRGRKVYRPGMEPRAGATEGREPGELEAALSEKLPERYRSELMTDEDWEAFELRQEGEQPFTAKALAWEPRTYSTADGGTVTDFKDAFRYAEDLVEGAGFKFHSASSESASSYWKRPGDDVVLRISDHPNYHPSKNPDGIVEARLKSGNERILRDEDMHPNDAERETVIHDDARGIAKIISDAIKEYDEFPRERDETEAAGLELLQRQRPTEPSNLHDIPGFHIGPNFLSPNELYQIKAFHGSPHDFERFDLSKIGTGEGTASHGEGIYLAENPAVSGRGGHYDEFFKRQTGGPAHIYEVNVKADPEHFLDWDKPLSEQSEHVKQTLGKLGVEPARHTTTEQQGPLSEIIEQWIRKTPAEQRKGVETLEPLLREAGIPGIKYLDQGSRSAGEGSRNYVIFDDKLIEITHKDGTPVTGKDRENIVNELMQGARGKVDLNPRRTPGRDFLGEEGVKPILRILREGNASTFPHESGHVFLAELSRDAEHPAAPGQLKADWQTTLKWLGAKSAEDLTRAQHEKFATGFEQYLREGTAPSAGLARVFAQFRQWLLKVYETIKGLGEPINEDIRGVFDRMLAENPERQPVQIIPEKELPKSLGEQRLAEAATVAPENAAGHAAVSEQHIGSIAGKNLLPEEQNGLIGNLAENRASSSADRETPPEHPQAPGGGTQPEARAGEGGGVARTGTAIQSGAEGTPEGAGAPAKLGKAVGAVKTEPPATANAPFSGPKSPLIDKAGNIRLDKLDTADDVTQVIRDTAAQNDNFWGERRGQLSDFETLELADALGMDPAWLDRKKIGDAFNVEEIRAARRLLVNSATAVRDAMVAAKDGAIENVKALGEAIIRHEMIQARIAQATAEAGRALRAFREVIPGSENIALVDTWLHQNTGRTLNQLVDMARYGSNLKKPSQISRFVNDTKNLTVKDAIVYYYVNALISGPITHLRYAAGNMLTALYTPVVKIPIAAGIGQAQRLTGFENAERVYLGEAGAQLYGIVKGSREGLKAALEGWKTGNTPHLPGEGEVNMFEAQPMVPPIPGLIGRVIGIPGKSVGAIHGFFSAIRYEQEINGMAYRTAMQEELTGQAFLNRVTDLTNRPTADMMEKASITARRDLYMAPSDYQSLEAKLARISNHNVATKVILPFVKIGTQITARAFEGTPLAPFQAKVRENLSGKNGAAARDMQLATIASGTALMATMSGMVLEGLATGDGPSDPGQRQVWLLNHHPNSIQIGNLSVSYARLGSLAMLMRTAANATEAYRGWGEDQGHQIAGDFLYGFEKAILEEGFLTGVKEMIDAIYHHEEYGQRYLAQMVTNWLPWSIGFGQVARLPFVDPYQRETRGNDFMDALWKDVLAKVPVMSRSLFPRRDMFGQPIPQSGPVQNYTNDRVVQAMNDLNIKVGRYERKIRGVALTDQQYDDFVRIAGRTTKMMLDNLVQPGFEMQQRGVQLELIHKMITEGRKVGENAVIMESIGTPNDIMKQALDDKVEMKTTGHKAMAH